MAILNVAGKKVEIKAGNMSVRDGLVIEDEYGSTIDVWMADLEARKLRAACVGILVLARRSDQSITMDDVLAIDIAELFTAIQTAMSPTAPPGAKVKPLSGRRASKSPTKEASERR